MRMTDPRRRESSDPPADNTQAVVVELPDDVRKRAQHEPATRRWIAQRVADLLGYHYAGGYAPDLALGSRLLTVPLYPSMQPDDVDFVCDGLQAAARQG